MGIPHSTMVAESQSTITMRGSKLLGLDWGSWDGWVAAILSAVAVVIAIWLANKAIAASNKIAARQAALDEESYLTTRMQELVQHARTTLYEAHNVQTLTSPRLYDLLSIDQQTEEQIAARQSAVLASLSRLDVEVSLLRAYAITMPRTTQQKRAQVDTLYALMDEGAWLYTEALHCAILAFEEPDSSTALDNDQAVVDALMNGAFPNLKTRLLSNCVGLDPDKIPYYSEPGSPWPEVYRRRAEMLLTTVMARKSWHPGSLAEAATWSLAHTIDRFQDSLIGVLQNWDMSREPKRTS